jgi:tetratricopeptide (TPR) repeat protein
VRAAEELGVNRVARFCASCAAICWIAGCAASTAPPPAPVAPAPEAETESGAASILREADSYAAIGRRDLAAPVYEQMIEMRATLGGPPPAEARSLFELAVIEHQRGRAAEAEHFYRRALAADGGAGPELRDLVRANLAWLLGERAAAFVADGHPQQAIESYQQALAIWEELQPASDELVAETLANLALMHRARGEREQARALLERTLPLYRKTLAEDDPIVVRVRALLADYALRANPPYEKDPAEVARDLDREGAALLDRRDYARARPLLERAVAIHERGVTAPVELGASLSYLGRTYAGLGERELARRTLERSIPLLVAGLGKLDPLTLATRASLENVRASVPASWP